MTSSPLHPSLLTGPEQLLTLITNRHPYAHTAKRSHLLEASPNNPYTGNQREKTTNASTTKTVLDYLAGIVGIGPTLLFQSIFMHKGILQIT